MDLSQRTEFCHKLLIFIKKENNNNNLSIRSKCSSIEFFAHTGLYIDCLLELK